MKLSATSMIFFFGYSSVGGAAANQGVLLRGSEQLTATSNSSRQLKSPNAKGKPAFVDWRCEDSPFDSCTTFAAGRGGGDTRQQCCECECDRPELEGAKDKCSLFQEEGGIEVSCADDGLIAFNVTLSSCVDICADACSTFEEST